jgi:hypothetical protein
MRFRPCHLTVKPRGIDARHSAPVSVTTIHANCADALDLGHRIARPRGGFDHIECRLHHPRHDAPGDACDHLCQGKNVG